MLAHYAIEDDFRDGNHTASLLILSFEEFTKFVV